MRFFLVLLIIAGFIAGYFLIENNRREHEERFWMNQCKDQLVHFIGPNVSHSLTPDEPSFFKLLLFLHTAEHQGKDITKILNDVFTDMNIDDYTSGFLRENILNDLKTANDLKIFDDPANLMNLEHGETAIVATPGWQGEKLVLLQIVPPLYAPEASQCLGNLVLAPELVRDAWPQEITPYVLERGTILQSRRCITRESFERIASAGKAALKR
jgi:hypothetical protein